jgi:hypothetical protein
MSSITLLSVYGIVLSLLLFGYTDKFGVGYSRFFSALSLLIAISIIVITLLEFSKNYAACAEQAYAVALQLSDLYNRFESFLRLSPNGDDTDFAIEYNDILAKARITRKRIDYHLVQDRNRKQFEIGIFRLIMHKMILLVENLWEYWIYVVIVTLPLALIAAAFEFPKAFGITK